MRRHAENRLTMRAAPETGETSADIISRAWGSAKHSVMDVIFSLLGRHCMGDKLYFRDQLENGKI